MRLFILTLVILLPLSAIALTAEERLSDNNQELRAHNLFKQIRCVVCAGESINDSKADLAKDLRILVRDMIKQGKKDTDILDFVTMRYGDAVLMKPPFQINTYILWFAPVVLFLLGAVGLVRFFKKN